MTYLCSDENSSKHIVGFLCSLVLSELWDKKSRKATATGDSGADEPY